MVKTGKKGVVRPGIVKPAKSSIVRYRKGMVIQNRDQGVPLFKKKGFSSQWAYNKVLPSHKRRFIFRIYVMCNIYKTPNNIFLTLTDAGSGQVILQLSGGKIGKKGPKRDTPNTAELLGRRFGEIFMELGYKRCITRINGPFDAFVRSAIRGILSKRVRMVQIRHIKNVSHNGVRPKNPKKK